MISLTNLPNPPSSFRRPDCWPEKTLAGGSTRLFRHGMHIGLLLLILLWAVGELRAQTCNVTDYLYLNDVTPAGGYVHKLKLNTNITATEIYSSGTNPWFPAGGILDTPHGLGQDLNGNLYIGQTGAGPIAKIKCNGTVVDPAFINDGGFNIVSRDGYLYVNSSDGQQISRYALCDGSAQGYIILGGTFSYSGATLKDWGLDIGTDGTFYASAGFNFTDRDKNTYLYRFKPTDADFTNHTVYTANKSTGVGLSLKPGTGLNGISDRNEVWGITHDPAGNIYLVVRDWENTSDTETWVLKFDSNFNLVDSIVELTSSATGGIEGARGIVYYAPWDRLLIAGGPDGDCVAKIRPSDMTYVGALAANEPGQTPKTLRIASEACPTAAALTVDTTMCNVKAGDKVFLQNIIGTCKAPICGGTWTANAGNAGLTFNECDLSFTVTNVAIGCGKFVLTNVGGTCGNFTITVNVDFANVTAPVIAGNQTVCATSEIPASFSVVTPATGSNTLKYQWQKSTTSCTAGFSNIASATASTYTPTVLSQTTYYRVVATVDGSCATPKGSCADTSNCVTVTTEVCCAKPVVSVTPGTCNSATNQYSISGTISLTNASAGVATITDGSKSTTVTITAGATSVAYSLTGLTSGSGSHTVVAALAGCGSGNAVYTAPASCTAAPGVCAIALKPTVSGCYSVTGTSKATVSVEVSWSNITVSPTDDDDSDAITITFAGVTKTINPGPYTSVGGNGTIVSPQVVAFEVTADASTKTAQVFIGTSYATATCKVQKTGIVLPAACPPTVCTTGQTGGTVFNDYNADGIKQTGETTGVPGVTVKAYDCTGTLVGTATTDAFGKYAFTGLTAASYPIRVEFSNLPAYAGMGTLNGADGRTTVQFINAANCDVDLGILDPTDYCQTNPKLVIPCYVNGDPLLPISSTASAGSSDAVVSFDYNTSGKMDMSLMAHTTASQVGTLWGMAYNKFTKKIFSSATVKRHAGLGPLGLGGIYVADFSTVPANGATFTYTNFLDVSTIGINVGTIASNSARGLVESKTAPSVDNQGYLAIGKVGIGGIDLSADGNKLYLTNLFDNKLYEINITAYNTNGTLPTAANVKSYDMSAGINCTGGNLRIWAVKVHKGKIYTGMVCDAGTSQSKSDLRAFVRELNGTTVSTVFDFPLSYPKGYSVRTSWGLGVTGWYPWTDDWTEKVIPGQVAVVHPEPIFSAVEFDIDGSMVLAFSDRTGFQAGFGNYNPNGDDGSGYSGYLGGDILRAYSNGVSFVLENNAKAGPNTGYGVDNNQGPGFGEFYNDNWVNFQTGTQSFHAENVSGGLALRPGSGEAIVGVMDPLDYPLGATDNVNTYYLNSGGVRHLDNQTGIVADAYQVYSTSQERGTFSKAVGLGDLVLICDTPDYLEIGNRLWVDEDKDGIQDPCEKRLPGVLVSLYRGNTKIATTTTNANGLYYFNNNPTSSTATNVTSNTAILPNTTYTVRFGTDGTTNQYDNTTGILTTSIGKFEVTTAFSTAPTANTMNDSNVQFSGGFLSASVTTGAAGSVNHTIDAGFVCAPTSVASVSVTLATCPASGTVANNNARIQLTGIACADKVFLVVAGGTIPSYTATGSQPVSASAASFTGLTNPATSAGRSYSLVLYNGPCCYTVVSTTLAQQTCLPPNLAVVVSTPVCNSTTNTYTATGTVSLTNATAGALTITNNGNSLTTINVTAGQTSATFSLSGISNGPATRTIVAALSSVTATATYVVPASCTVCTTNLVTSTLPNGQVGTAYSRTLVTSGGTTPYSYTVSTGTLPTGLTLNPTTGVIAGTPSAPATSVFTIKVTDAKSCTDVQSFTIVTSALPVCSLDLLVTPGTCNSATNQYSISGTVTLTNPTAGNLVITDGAKSTTLTITASTTSVAYSLTGLTSGSGSHTVVASLTGCGSDNAAYTAPASCTIAPPALAIVVGTPVCNSATNNYTATGTVSLSNATAGTLTITDNGTTIGTVSVITGQTMASFSVSGISNVASHTVIATLNGLSASTTYLAPTSCTVCSLSLVTTSLPKGQVGVAYSRLISVTGGTTPYNFSVSAGTLPTGLTLNPTTGRVSGTPTISGNFPTTIVVTDAKGCAAKLLLSVFEIDQVPQPAIAIVVNSPVCNSATNTYTATGTVSLTNATAGSLTITDGGNPVAVIAVTTGQTSANFSLTGISNGPAVQVVSATLGAVTASTTYTTPASCTSGAPAYAIAKVINQNRIEKGGIVTYTISLTNIGNATGTNIVVGDQLSSTQVTFVGNATASVGTFLPAGNSGNWTIASLAAGQVATLSFQVQINEEGLTYNTATAPDGKTVTACLTVPFHVCADEDFEIELEAPASYSTYQWSRNGVAIPGATSATYSVTAIGEYTVATTKTAGCPDGSCCPFVVVADAVPSLTALAVAATCTGSTPLDNASITLVGSSTNAVSYNVSLGNSFSASAPLFTTDQPLAAVVGGVLLANQPNPVDAPGISYTIRVYAANGCSSDVVVVIPPAQCQCPPVKCAPFVIKKISRR
ncbi:SdrD B-like domain-containing protein [Fibrella aquatica]|uniref:SdrD B-like domain-containing protein n=1 Tax=Fibrella aquatica TaxID=3242487 RepID=UPI00352242A5